MDKDNQNKNFKDRISVYSAVIFALTFIVVGFPLWWKTTETYKVPLPYNEINILPLLEIVHLIPVTVVLADRTIHQSALWEQLLLLSDQEYENGENTPQLKFQYSWKMRSINRDEERAFMLSTNMYDLDKVLKSNASIAVETGEIHIIVLEDNFEISPTSFVIGCHRRAYIVNKFGSELSNGLGENIISLVKSLVQSEVLHQHFNNPSSYVKKKPEKERMRSLSTTTMFDINFSLVVPEPLKNNVHWDIETAVNGYVTPYVQQLSVITEVDIKSQILYMSPLPIHSSYDSEKKWHVFSEDQLPSIINPIEAKLGSYASINPTLNFVVYIPPENQSPLYISDTSGFLMSSNAFLSPQWGGFLFYNLPEKKSQEDLSRRIDLDMRKVMEVFLGHLKLLLGLPDVEAVENDNIHVLQDPVLSDWEVDFLLRKNCQEQLFTAMSSLHSLSHLLQTIENIVIKDDVGKKIYSSVSSIKKSVSLLQQGALEDAFLQAKQGFTDSEAAFFDPSLLALLYFPDDQKYAIYIPLFLPISLPVIMSLCYIWEFWKGSEGNSEKNKQD